MPKLGEALLPFTLANAARLSFYTSRWEGIDIDAISSTAELCRLPLLSKEDYRRYLMFDAAAVSDAQYVSHTTGTTGLLTWRHRSVGEASIINQLFGYATKTPSDQLMLVVRYNRHGMAMPVPGNSRSVPISLYNDIEVRQSLQMLTATYHFSEGALRPTTVAGGSQDIALLAQAWRETRKSDEQTAIKQIQLGRYADTGLRQFLRDCFNQADLVEKYSLAEIFGGATRRWPSPSFILDPYVVGEVTDEQGNPVAIGGIGELVLTELFPFVQMQPLIRYRTGDIVRLVRNDDHLEFEWWGRRDDCVLVRRDSGWSWVLGYRPLADWLSLQPLVARMAHRPYLTSVKSTDVGPPCVALGKDPDSQIIRVTVGLQINLWWNRPTMQTFVVALWDTLRSIVTAPPDDVRIRLCLRHVAVPTEDFHEVADSHDLQLPTQVLASSAPVVP